MNIRTLFLASVLQTLFVVSNMAVNIVERSQRNVPRWVNGLCQDYVVTTATGTSLESARNLAIDQVRENIILSISVHIESETHIKTEQEGQNGQYSIKSNYIDQIKTKAACIPYLHNISASYVEEYYWEKVRKGDGAYEYHYSIKYPFSDTELNSLIAEFEARELALDQQLSTFNRTFVSWRDLISAENQLYTFTAKLPSCDEEHIQQCKSLLDNYHNQHRELLGDFLVGEYTQLPVDGCKVYETPTDTIWVSIVTLNPSSYQNTQAMDRVAAVKANRQTAEVMNSGTVIIAESHITESENSTSYTDEIVAKFRGRTQLATLLKKFVNNNNQYVYIYVL